MMDWTSFAGGAAVMFVALVLPYSTVMARRVEKKDRDEVKGELKRELKALADRMDTFYERTHALECEDGAQNRRLGELEDFVERHTLLMKGVEAALCQHYEQIKKLEAKPPDGFGTWRLDKQMAHFLEDCPSCGGNRVNHEPGCPHGFFDKRDRDITTRFSTLQSQIDFAKTVHGVNKKRINSLVERVTKLESLMTDVPKPHPILDGKSYGVQHHDEPCQACLQPRLKGKVLHNHGCRVDMADRLSDVEHIVNDMQKPEGS